MDSIVSRKCTCV